MAEAEITIRYRELPAAFLYRLLLFLLPIYALFIVWSGTVLVFSVGVISFEAACVVVAVEILLFVAFAFLAVVLRDDTVYVTRDGISFPFTLCPSLSMRTQKSWHSLSGVDFDLEEQRSKLSLFFKNGPPVTLKLSHLEPRVVEDLIVAIDVWGGGCDSFPALLEARAFLSGEGSTEELSYTDMWEEELGRRFGSTNFIPLEPGQTVMSGRLEVERQIAFGGMSAIYLVRDSDHTSFVLKESVVPDDSNDELRDKAAELLAKEAKILTSLDHPQIASIKDHFVEGNRDYLLLEHLKGQDLRRLVREFGAQEESKVIIWSMQIAEILTYLHERETPVIHKDLTPSNLILMEDGRIGLIDFGAANLFLGTATATVIGKQAFIAPEQLRGKPRIQSDIYALGGTMFFLLTGEDPEPISCSHPKKSNPRVSVDMDELVARCTSMEHDDRPAGAGEVLEALSDLNRKRGS